MDVDQLEQLTIINPDIKWVVNTKEFDAKKKGEYIESPTFFINNTIKNMSLQLFPKGIDSIDCSNGSMSLFLSNDNDYDVTVFFSISLLNNNEEKVYKVKTINDKIESKTCKGSPSFVMIKDVFNQANNLIKDDKITIICTIYAQIVTSGVKKNQNNLINKNEKLLIQKTHSDVVIKCNDQEFYLHKCILASCSNVFEAMFETDMVEKEKNIVEINDINPKILEQFFKYLYTNKVDNFKEIAKDLLIVADKYLVSDLKDECEESMLFNINMQNAIEYLKIADNYNAEKLRYKAMKFISSNKLKNFTGLDVLSKEQLLKIIYI